MALGLLALALAVGPAQARPGSSPVLTLTGVEPWQETELFDSVALLDVFDDALADENLDVLDLLGGKTSLACDSEGVLYVAAEAYDSTDTTTFNHPNGYAYTDLTQVYTGILSFDPSAGASGALGLERADVAYWADGATGQNSDMRGVRYNAIACAPATAGGLQQDDLVVLLWSSDGSSANGDLELVRLARSGSGTDDVLATWPAAVTLAHGLLAIDEAGALYVSSRLVANRAPFVDRVAWNGSSWSTTDLTPSIGMIESLGVAPDGTVYAVGESFGTYDATILERDPSTGAWSEFATYGPQSCCIENFRALAVGPSGTLHAALGARRQPGDYIAAVASGDNVTYSDRLAETTYAGVNALVAGTDGALYVVHQERALDGNGNVVYTRKAVYQIAPSSGGGSGGGDGGSGGGSPPPGKGRNK